MTAHNSHIDTSSTRSSSAISGQHMWQCHTAAVVVSPSVQSTKSRAISSSWLTSVYCLRCAYCMLCILCAVYGVYCSPLCIFCVVHTVYYACCVLCVLLTSVYCGSAAWKPLGIWPNISFSTASARRRTSATDEPSSASSGGTSRLLTGAGPGPQLAPTRHVSI